MRFVIIIIIIIIYLFIYYYYEWTHDPWLNVGIQVIRTPASSHADSANNGVKLEHMTRSVGRILRPTERVRRPQNLQFRSIEMR